MTISGELAADYILPPERKLAETLGVNRSTVLNAYQELKADGFITSHVGRGTVVLSHNVGEPVKLQPVPCFGVSYLVRALFGLKILC